MRIHFKFDIFFSLTFNNLFYFLKLYVSIPLRYICIYYVDGFIVDGFILYNNIAILWYFTYYNLVYFDIYAGLYFNFFSLSLSLCFSLFAFSFSPRLYICMMRVINNGFYFHNNYLKNAIILIAYTSTSEGCLFFSIFI
jgi:hypothetical protein